MMTYGDSWMKSRRLVCRLCLFAALAPAAVGRGSDAAEGVQLEVGLQQAAPEIIRWLQANGCRSVGVLKFHIQKGRGAASENRGTLNMSLANRLESALLLANPKAEAQQIRLVRRASSVASAIAGANHLSQVGRSRLFSAAYPLAWGRTQTTVDAFVTGVVMVAPDFRSMRVRFVVVRQRGPGVEPVARQLVVATNGAILNELGESYQLRSVAQDLAADAVRDVRANPQTRFPLMDQPQVALRILYDGQAVDVDFLDGEASIPEPREGQAVTFQIQRMDQSRGALAAVLKVNGENVLFRERSPDIDCSKYVLERNSPPIAVDGYQTEDSQAEAFRVAARAESQALEMYYGQDVGTLSLVVFREAEEHAASGLKDREPELAAIAQGHCPVQPAESLTALQEQLRAEALRSVTRGVLVPGGPLARAIQLQEKRSWCPEPILSAVIHYYRPPVAP